VDERQVEQDREGGDGAAVASRLARLERIMTSLAKAVAGQVHEVRTRRLVVTDVNGHEVVVAETVGATTELRVEIPGADPGKRSAVVLFATGPDPGSGPRRLPGVGAGPGVGGGLGPGVGLQLWALGDEVAELDAWPGDDRGWRAHLFLDGEP